MKQTRCNAMLGVTRPAIPLTLVTSTTAIWRISPKLADAELCGYKANKIGYHGNVL